MKKIICEKMYNTETAKLIGIYDSSKVANFDEDVLEELVSGVDEGGDSNE